MRLRGHGNSPRASIEEAGGLTGADLNEAEKAIADQIMEGLISKPSFDGDLHIWGFDGDFRDMHLCRANGVYVMYQIFANVFPQRGRNQKYPFHIILWRIGRFQQDAKYLRLDCLPDPIPL